MAKGDHIYYKKGYKYQTTRDYTLFTGITPPKSLVFKWAILSDNGFLTIIHDYAWNGASGPTFDTKDSMRGSLVHDVFTQMIRLGYLDPSWWPKINDLLHDILVEDGMWHFRAEGWEEAVSHFGSSSTTIAEEPEEMEAP